MTYVKIKMIWKRCAIFLSLLFVSGFSLILLPNRTQAISNEVGNFKNTTWNTGVTYDKNGTLTTVNNNSDSWQVYSDTTVATPRVNLGQSVNVAKGDIATISMTLISVGGIQEILNTPPSYCLTSSWQWVVVQCNSQFQFIEETEYLYNYIYADLGNTNNSLKGHLDIYTKDKTDIHYAVYTFNYTIRFSASDRAINNILFNGVLTRGSGLWLVKMSSISFFDGLPQGAMQANEQQTQAGQQAQQDGQTSSNQSQSDAQTGSASLLQGASSIIGALTDTQASNCSINLNMGNIDLGTQDFCQGDIGPIRPVIATITNVLFAFVALKVFTFLIGVMFGLFDEFFGTKTEKGGA